MDNVKVGDKVTQLTITGSYSQYMISQSNSLVKLPDSIDPIKAVSLILGYVTTYQMLTRIIKIKKGSVVLMHGAGGVVGTALMQLCRNMGLKMYGTASYQDREVLLQYDCVPIDYKN